MLISTQLLKLFENVSGVWFVKYGVSVSVSFAAHTSLKAWLESLRLAEYLDAFTKNNFTNVEKLRKIWEVELTTVQIVVINFSFSY